MTPRQQQIALSVGGVVVALVAMRLLAQPAVAYIGRQRAALGELRAKAAEAAMLVPQRAALEGGLQRAQDRSQSLEARVRDQSVATILEALSREAKAHYLELTVVQESAPDVERVVRFGPHLALREVPLRVHLRGRYRQVGEFLGALRAAPFLAAVREAEIVKSVEQFGQLTADLQLVVYLADKHT